MISYTGKSSLNILAHLLNVSALVGVCLLFVACNESGSEMIVSPNNVNSWSEDSGTGTIFSSTSNVTPLPTSSLNQSNLDIEYGEWNDSRDGQTYKTVTIGTQTWFAQNLNFQTDSSFCYNYVESYCTKYGRLYRWAAAVGEREDECGDGYKCSLPSGNIQGVCPSGWHLPSKTEWETLFNAVGRQSIAGIKLKSTSGWFEGGYGMDAFGFSALPAGLRNHEGLFEYETAAAYFWSSTEESRGDDAYYVNLWYSSHDAYLFSDHKYLGFSVRCVKGDASEPKRISNRMTDPRNGQTYKTVSIGSQTWMAENLNFQTGYSSCYDNEESNCTKYGRLYRWAPAVGKLESECGLGKECSLPSGNIQGVCPSGWHLPSKAEWETLFNAVGGLSTAGKVLKSTSGWTSRGNGTDAFGFSALPAGLKDDTFSEYYYEGTDAYFWGSTEYGRDEAFNAHLYSSYDRVFLDESNYNRKNQQFSVRCVKD